MLDSSNWNWDALQPVVTGWALHIGGALLTLLVGLLAAKLIVRAVRKAFARTKLEDLAEQFILTIVRTVALVIVGVAVLEQLGVNMTSLVAALGAVGLAVGLALKDSLSNLASGLMLVVQRPFSKEDFVEVAGTSGMVEDINLTTTTLRTPDNRSVIVPNGMISSDVITNYSQRERRRVDMKFGIDYGDDIEKARQAILNVLNADPRVLADPEPFVAVSELADSSVNFIARPWVLTDDYWPVYWDVTEKVKLALDSEGISIPFPQADIRIHQVA